MESGLATQTRRGRGRNDRRPRNDNEGVLPVLAQAVRRLENAVQRGRVQGGDYNRYQAIALLAREERIRVRGRLEATHRRVSGGVALVPCRRAIGSPLTPPPAASRRRG